MVVIAWRALTAMREIWVSEYATYQGKFVKFSEMSSNPNPIYKLSPTANSWKRLSIWG